MNKTIEALLQLPQQLKKDEIWRNVDFSRFLTDDMSEGAVPDNDHTRLESCRCRIPDLNAQGVMLVNGHSPLKLHTLDNGVVIGSLKEALRAYPEMEERMLQCVARTNPYEALNRQYYSDGLFIMVPDGVFVEHPIQLQSAIQSESPLCIQARNLVCLGKGSQLSLIQCDDSYNNLYNFSNNVTALWLDENAHLQLYKLQNMNDQSALLNHTYALMQDSATIRSAYITLNGGSIRNHTEVRMVGQNCDTQIDGLYLLDHEQQADNYVYVEHQAPHCTSRELFKGIVDDQAKAVFNGHVLVKEGAVKTEAYQSNRNILLTDKATVDTRPFLEIYNDDVKCSHGSTIGQLDEQALFYIQQRGISLRTAKTLLMAAFCDEVIQSVALEPLRRWLGDMSNRRLHGDLSACTDCALSCSEEGACQKMEHTDFHIDTSKL